MWLLRVWETLCRNQKKTEKKEKIISKIKNSNIFSSVLFDKNNSILSLFRFFVFCYFCVVFEFFEERCIFPKNCLYIQEVAAAFEEIVQGVEVQSEIRPVKAWKLLLLMLFDLAVLRGCESLPQEMASILIQIVRLLPPCLRATRRISSPCHVVPLPTLQH